MSTPVVRELRAFVDAGSVDEAFRLFQTHGPDEFGGPGEYVRQFREVASRSRMGALHALEYGVREVPGLLDIQAEFERLFRELRDEVPFFAATILERRSYHSLQLMDVPMERLLAYRAIASHDPSGLSWERRRVGELLHVLHVPEDASEARRAFEAILGMDPLLALEIIEHDSFGAARFAHSADLIGLLEGDDRDLRERTVGALARLRKHPRTGRT